MPSSPELPPLSEYSIHDTSRIVTPALLIYPEKLHHNIKATIAMVGGDANRWRPHIKTAKLAAVVKGYIRDGVLQFKCSTTLELLTACEAGAADVLVAFSLVGANALRAREIAAKYANTRVSVLAESAAQAELWISGSVSVFLDLNSGMNRTGIEAYDGDKMIRLARLLGANFRGLHWYDGHVNTLDQDERKAQAFAGYDRLMKIVEAFQSAGVAVKEIVTSGTPAAPYGYAYGAFQNAAFVHRISPGTVVYNDLSSLKQLPGYGYVPAAVVLATVISHPKPGVVTCDAGHKAVGVDSGVPNCAVLGHPGLTPLKPSEEHLPLDVTAGASTPAIGEKLYLVPHHVCPTVNNFDQALIIDKGDIVAVELVTARGHEHPLSLSMAAGWANKERI
jgi:D-serine deaminase-like pyridoxal phosphate-dependent protein